MDMVSAIVSDGGLLLFSVAGLVATSVAILLDTRTQNADHLAGASVRADR